MIDVLVFCLGLIAGSIITCIVVTGEGYKMKLNRKKETHGQR